MMIELVGFSGNSVLWDFSGRKVAVKLKFNQYRVIQQVHQTEGEISCQRFGVGGQGLEKLGKILSSSSVWGRLCF